MADALLKILSSQQGKTFHRTELLARAQALGVVTTAAEPLDAVDNGITELRKKGMSIDRPAARSYQIRPTPNPEMLKPGPDLSRG